MRWNKKKKAVQTLILHALSTLSSDGAWRVITDIAPAMLIKIFNKTKFSWAMQLELSQFTRSFQKQRNFVRASSCSVCNWRLKSENAATGSRHKWRGTQLQQVLRKCICNNKKCIYNNKRRQLCQVREKKQLKINTLRPWISFFFLLLFNTERQPAAWWKISGSSVSTTSPLSAV